MAGSRKWITREEIAEIYDSMADKADKEFEGIPLVTTPSFADGAEDEMRQIMSSRLGAMILPEDGMEVITRGDVLRRRAADVRATERLSNKLGDRVA